MRPWREVAASHGTPLILMHNQEGTRYTRLIPDIVASLRRSVAVALAAGVARERIIVDPGFGFGKTVAHNLEVLRRLGEIKSALGLPLLLGTSRKSTIGRVLDLPVDDRVEGTAATVALGIAQGADIVRVHDVREMARVVRMADAVARGGRGDRQGGDRRVEGDPDSASLASRHHDCVAVCFDPLPEGEGICWLAFRGLVVHAH